MQTPALLGRPGSRPFKLFATGCRRMEVLQLKVKDVNLSPSDPTITFRHDCDGGQFIKTKETATLLMTKHLRGVLLDYGIPDDPDAWVFPSKKGQEKHMDWPKGSFLRAKELAGMPDWSSSRTIRRSVGTHLCRQGMHPTLVSRFLRHHSLDVTEKYVDLETQDLTAITGKLEPNDSGNDSGSSELAEKAAVMANGLSEVIGEYHKACTVERETGFEPATLSLEG